MTAALAHAVDLHCHTWWSFDGFTSFSELHQWQRQRGVVTLAVTDHDTLDGWCWNENDGLTSATAISSQPLRALTTMGPVGNGVGWDALTHTRGALRSAFSTVYGILLGVRRIVQLAVLWSARWTKAWKILDECKEHIGRHGIEARS